MVKQLNIYLDDSDHERAKGIKDKLDLTWSEFIIEAAECLENSEVES